MATQQRSEETRVQILSAAGDCFAQSGYDGVSVAQICRRAGVSKGAFYHHFSSKHNLFLELIDEWLVEQDHKLAEIRDRSANVPEGLLAMSTLAPEIYRFAGQNITTLLQFLNQADLDTEVRQALHTYLKRYRAFFADLIRAGIKEGSLRSLDPDRAAQATLSLALGTLLQGLLDPVEEEESFRQSMQLLLEGLKPVPG